MAALTANDRKAPVKPRKTGKPNRIRKPASSCSRSASSTGSANFSAGLMIASHAAKLRAELGTATQIEQTERLDSAIMLAAGLAHAGDVVLLSPGGTSYDAYKDFEERGQHFRELVNAL